MSNISPLKRKANEKFEAREDLKKTKVTIDPPLSRNGPTLPLLPQIVKTTQHDSSLLAPIIKPQSLVTSTQNESLLSPPIISTSFPIIPVKSKTDTSTSMELENVTNGRLDVATVHLKPGSTLPKREKEKLSPVKVSARVQKQKAIALEKLTGLSPTTGSKSSDHSANDVTPFFMLPLDPGNDFRGYTSNEARNAINKKVEQSKKKASTLEELNLPNFVLNMHATAEKTHEGMFRRSTRSNIDGFKSGLDLTYTANQELPHDKRVSSDTPRPRSPNPYQEDHQLNKDVRYENAHQGAFRFSGESGGTVHAPTQGNQVVDTAMERFIAKKNGGFIVRMDTYEASSLWAVRPSKSGYKSIQASYMRRSVPEDTK